VRARSKVEGREEKVFMRWTWEREAGTRRPEEGKKAGRGRRERERRRKNASSARVVYDFYVASLYVQSKWKVCEKNSECLLFIY